MTIAYHEYIPFDSSPLPIRINYDCSLHGSDHDIGYTHPWHEQVELLYFHQGDATIFCGNQSFTVKAGDTIFINPCETHLIQYKQGDPLYDCVIIDLEQYRLVESDNRESRYFDLLISRHIRFQNLLQQDAVAAAHMQAICAEFREQNFIYEIAIRSHILGLFSHLFRHYLSNTVLGQINKGLELYNRIKPAIDYMQEHLREKITLKQLSLLCNLSEAHFSRLFRQITNTSPIQYLHTLRLNEVASLLKNSSKSITEIAEETGFEDVAYLSRKFKSEFMISPLQFRKRNKGF